MMVFEDLLYLQDSGVALGNGGSGPRLVSAGLQARGGWTAWPAGTWHAADQAGQGVET